MAENPNNTNAISAVAELQARVSSWAPKKKNVVKYAKSEANKAILAASGKGVTHTDLNVLAESESSKSRCAAFSNPAFKKAELANYLVIATANKWVPETQAILMNLNTKSTTIKDWAASAGNLDATFLSAVLTKEVVASLSARKM